LQLLQPLRKSEHHASDGDAVAERQLDLDPRRRQIEVQIAVGMSPLHLDASLAAEVGERARGLGSAAEEALVEIVRPQWGRRRTQASS
jgi:hypothetical protein